MTTKVSFPSRTAEITSPCGSLNSRKPKYFSSACWGSMPLVVRITRLSQRKSRLLVYYIFLKCFQLTGLSPWSKRLLPNCRLVDTPPEPGQTQRHQGVGSEAKRFSDKI